MAVAGWVLDKSAAARVGDPNIARDLADLAGSLFLCPVGELEQLYSARSADDYERMKADLHRAFDVAAAPADLLDLALRLQQDLAHHHGMWHRTAIPDRSSPRRHCTTGSAWSTWTVTSTGSRKCVP